MPDPQQLLEEFKAAFEAGGALDLDALMARAEDADRQELGALIDQYLMDAPRRPFDAVAYETSHAKQSVDRVFESLEGVSGTWPELLPALRNRAKIKRAELVERLAAALGFADRTERVAYFYNQMEHGLLPAPGVSARVLEALAGIVGASAETLRKAGERSGAAEAGQSSLTFARSSMPDPDYAMPALAADAGPAERREAERDELDDLFTGGEAG